MNKKRIEHLYHYLFDFEKETAQQNIKLSSDDRLDIQNDLIEISYDIQTIDPYYSKELFDLKDILFLPTGHIHPAYLGEIVAILGKILYSTQIPWNHMHPLIVKSSQKLYLDGHFADAAVDAFIEINARVKKLYAKVRPDEKVPDGDGVMKKAFSPENPAIRFCALSTDTGRNIQKGYMEMLAGAMSALRNPNAHENIPVAADDAMRRLQFASMLMYKIDEAVAYSKIQEP